MGTERSREKAGRIYTEGNALAPPPAMPGQEGSKDESAGGREVPEGRAPAVPQEGEDDTEGNALAPPPAMPGQEGSKDESAGGREVPEGRAPAVPQEGEDDTECLATAHARCDVERMTTRITYWPGSRKVGARFCVTAADMSARAGRAQAIVPEGGEDLHRRKRRGTKGFPVDLGGEGSRLGLGGDARRVGWRKDRLDRCAGDPLLPTCLCFLCYLLLISALFPVWSACALPLAVRDRKLPHSAASSFPYVYFPTAAFRRKMDVAAMGWN